MIFLAQSSLLSGVRPLPNECPRYDNKQSAVEVPVRLELWGRPRSISLPLLLVPLWAGVVTPERVLSIGQKNYLPFKLNASK